MWASLWYSRQKQRIYRRLIILVSIGAVFVYIGVFIVQKIFTPKPIEGIEFQPVMIYHFMERTAELKSAIYAPTMTNFDDSFPPNTKRALTLDTEFAIGNFDMCTGRTYLAYVVVVHSAVDNFDRRRTIRSTWGWTNLIRGSPSRTIFLLGQTADKIVQYAVLKENNLYGDIIQGHFIDDHQNLTLKNVMGLRWLVNYCSQAKVVIKVDDDVFVDIFRAKEVYFGDLLTFPKQLICEVQSRRTPIYRIKDWPLGEKSTVSDDYFKGLERYPFPFCFGFVVFMSMELTKELYHAALVSPAYPLDDVYVYGILHATLRGATWRNEVDRVSKMEEETWSNWGCRNKQPFIVGTFTSLDSAKNLLDEVYNCILR